MVQIHDRDRRHSSDAEQTKTQTGPQRHASVSTGCPGHQPQRHQADLPQVPAKRVRPSRHSPSPQCRPPRTWRGRDERPVATDQPPPAGADFCETPPGEIKAFAGLSQYAAAAARSTGPENVETRELDGESLAGIEDESIDAVISGLGIIYFPDQLGALAEMRRVLRPGGRLAAVAFSTPENGRFLSVAVGIIRRRAELAPPLPGRAPGPFSLGRGTESSRPRRAGGLSPRYQRPGRTGVLGLSLRELTVRTVPAGQKPAGRARERRNGFRV